MGITNKQKAVIYLGEFDLRHENAQALLVRNNSKALNSFGYKVAFIGVNREICSWSVSSLNKLNVGDGNVYLELPNTLSMKGILMYHDTSKRVLNFLSEFDQHFDVQFLISYQAPTFAPILKRIAIWCKEKGVKYIVNSADIPIFDSQPVVRRIAMKLNWGYLHRVNKKYADGLIAVSRYIEKFYQKDGMPSVIIPPLFDDYNDDSYVLADKVTFIYAGTPFTIGKNVKRSGMKDRLDKIIDYFLQLSADGVEFRLLVIGITKESYTMCVPSHKEALDNNLDIHFMGRCSHVDTLNAVKDADYMINIRDINKMNEAGLSTKLVESVSLGTPVVMNSVGDNFLYLREGITGFELSGNREKDILTLKSLCNTNNDERISLKNDCAGDKTFSVERYKPKLADFLNEVLSHSDQRNIN